MTEVWRSRVGRYSIMRTVDRYEVYDESTGRPVEVWSCWTLAALYAWMDLRGLTVADFDEV